LERLKHIWLGAECRSACRRKDSHRRARWRAPLVVAAVLLLLPIVLSLVAPTIDATTTTQGPALRQQLAQKQAELKTATGKLNALQKELDRVAEEQNAVEVRLAELEDEIAKTERDIAKSQEDLNAALATLEERLVGLYKQGSSNTWPYAEVLVSETDLTSLLERFDALSLIADEDQKLFDEVEAFLEAQEVSKRLLQEKQAEQAADLEELSRVQEDASERFAAADQTYATLKGQITKLKADIKKADAAAAAAAEAARKAAIRRMAWQQGKRWNNSGGGTIQPPQFVFPVKGANSYINSWGFARSGGRTHKGCDIMAARGTPLVACVTGSISGVSRADVGLGGITVHVKGNNGYIYYYAHLDRVASGIQEGMAIKTGTIVGYVGNSGNARRGACHLHFGMQPGAGASVNPYATLRFYEE
jgi:murein DD-endopeptidase MepM/ murein hydrolase activator NlpD